ncbi:MAG: hypothetical protein AB2L20_19040 [Mangrovibacterium sp.]
MDIFIRDTCGLFVPFAPHCAHKPRFKRKDTRAGIHDRNQAAA